MHLYGNTLLITGGTSGIGRALAEAFHARGNRVIIAGRRQALLDEVTALRPGMRGVILDMEDGDAIQATAQRLLTEFPALNAVIHNAGIQRFESLKEGRLDDAEATINTNLLGPIRLNAALLDALREQLLLTGTKKGCNQGACGACTVHINGHRVNSCLTLAIMHQGDEITTIEGLAQGDQLHPMQAAFIEHEGLQCGYCTSGQIMSGVACVREGHADTDAEVREWMSGNLCRCAAYNGIVQAVRAVKEGSV